jgi:hypothetical protein
MLRKKFFLFFLEFLEWNSFIFLTPFHRYLGRGNLSLKQLDYFIFSFLSFFRCDSLFHFNVAPLSFSLLLCLQIRAEKGFILGWERTKRRDSKRSKTFGLVVGFRHVLMDRHILFRLQSKSKMWNNSLT